jgi:N-dimethylarginine dimethylaminohydrolase
VVDPALARGGTATRIWSVDDFLQVVDEVAGVATTRGAVIDLYLMSPPGRGWALRGRANFRSREATPVDALQARREWLRLAEEIESRGGTVVALRSPSDELSGMPYAAECGHAFVPARGRPRFLLPRMAAAHRREERDHWAPLAATLGLEVIDPGEGTWEGQGDVAEFDGATLLFYGGRTDRAGMDAAASHLEGELLRLEIREPAFHGNMALLPLPEVGRMLVCPEVLVGDGMARLEQRFGKKSLVPVTEDEIRCYATNGLPIGVSLLAPSVMPTRVRTVCEELGMRVVLLGMGELCEKAGGASRCLVSHARVPDEVAANIPVECRLATVAAEIRADAKG